MKFSRYIIPAFALLALGMQSCGEDADDIVVDVTEKTYSAAAITNKIETTLVVAQEDGEKVDLYLFDKDNLTYQMAFVAQENVEYSLTSSNSEVASVDEEGLITGLKAGKTTVTLECGSLKKTVEVACHNFKVTKEEMKCPLGYDRQIPLLKSEAAKLTFKSSNTEIVTVTAEGVVNGIAEGEAKITITDGVESVDVAVKVGFTDFYSINGVEYTIDKQSEMDSYGFTLTTSISDGYGIYISVYESHYGQIMHADYAEEDDDYLGIKKGNKTIYADEVDSHEGYYIVKDLGNGKFLFDIDMKIVDGSSEYVIKATNLLVDFSVM